MKTLLLLRHAKAEAGHGIRDFDRTLAERGRHDAPEAGRELSRRGVRPDVIVSSPATRARETADAARDAAGLDTTIRFEPDVYDGSSKTLLNVVRDLPASTSCALLVGHNPGFAELLSRLAPASDADMPTCALVAVGLDAAAWDDVADGCGRVLWEWTPRSHS